MTLNTVAFTNPNAQGSQVSSEVETHALTLDGMSMWELDAGHEAAPSFTFNLSTFTGLGIPSSLFF